MLSSDSSHASHLTLSSDSSHASHLTLSSDSSHASASMLKAGRCMIRNYLLSYLCNLL
jgi:hypothetical protein